MTDICTDISQNVGVHNFSLRPTTTLLTVSEVILLKPEASHGEY